MVDIELVAGVYKPTEWEAPPSMKLSPRLEAGLWHGFLSGASIALEG